MYEPELEEHYEDLGKQEHAARLGLWVFLASELLFFAALFTLYAAYRTELPHVFEEGVHHNPVAIGSINTAILLLGSILAALAVQATRADRWRTAARLLAATALAALAFLVLKSWEYGIHFAEGIYPDGTGRFFAEHAQQGWAIFFVLYFASTGLHAIHVLIGLALMAWAARWVHRERVGRHGAYRVELVALYWHFVDVVWIFLWPMFYLMGEHG